MLTAKDLLLKTLDYDGYWNTSKQMENSKPAKARKLELDILLDGFGITTKNAHALSQASTVNIDNSTRRRVTVYSSSNSSKGMNRLEYIDTLTTFQYFTSGEFIADFDRTRYKNLIEHIVSTMKTIFPEQVATIDKEPLNLVHVFSTLYNFRMHIYQMTKYIFSKKMHLAFVTEDDFCLHIRKNYMTAMENNLTEVEELLSLLINPEGKELEEQEIGFPSFDIEALDEEWENRRSK